MHKNSNDQDDHKPDEKPISLKPLEFEEAVNGLLIVKPNKVTGGPDGGQE